MSFHYFTRLDDCFLSLFQLFERRASCVEALVAAAALPMDELLTLAAGADPCPEYSPCPSATPSPPVGEEARCAGATPDPASAAAPGPAAESAPAAAPASPLAAAHGAGEPGEGVAEAAAAAVHDLARSAPALNLAPAAVQRTLLLPLAGAAGATGGSQAWRGARLRVCIGYGVAHLPNAGGGEAMDAVRGETAGGEGLGKGWGMCSESPAPWLEDACTSTTYGDSGSEAGKSTSACLYCRQDRA